MSDLDTKLPDKANGKDDDWLEFEIKEAKKQYDDFPYWKKEHFKSVRRSVFGSDK